MSDLREVYARRYSEVLQPLSVELEKYIQELFAGYVRVDRISARAKSIDRFVDKANKVDDETGKPKYLEPLHQIQDQLGARIVTFYLSDVNRVSEHILKYFQPIEAKDLVPESESEFGYFGRHFVLILPTDIFDASMDRKSAPEFFELQIKTLFQHAWSEADHDLGYKPHVGPLPPNAKRRLAFTAAQAWGADQIFNELFSEVQAANGG